MAQPPRAGTAGRSLRGVPQVPVARPAAPRPPAARLPRAPGAPAPPLVPLVLWPALFTLGVTLLRLVGELRGWSPDYFSKLPGGGLAFVGIVWLIPPVGAWLGFRLARAGVRVPGWSRLPGWPAASVAVGLLLGYGLKRLVQPSWTGTLSLWAAVAVAVAVCSFLAWPALGKPLLVYAFLARIPVVVVMAFAIWRRWGTHYDVPPPGFPALFPTARWLWTGLLPQVTIWIAITLSFGAIFAAAGAWLATRRPR